MKKTKTLHRMIQMWAACEPIAKGACICRLGNWLHLYDSYEHAIFTGWRKDQIVEVWVQYKKTEKTKCSTKSR